MQKVRKITELELKKGNIENYRFESKIICEFLEKKFPFLSEQPKQSNEFLHLAMQIAERRKKKEPLQYIIGEWEFYGDTYKLNEHCLIPRPETEFLTEVILKNCGADEKIVDLCCGSGCIAISALKRRKDLTCVSIDISLEAVLMAEENAKLNGVHDRIKFYVKDILNQTDEVKRIISEENCTFLVSNPPYLSKKDMEIVRNEKKEVSYEPKIALYGGEDGCDFYRHIIKFYADSNSIRRTAFELGINQFSTVEKLLNQQNFKTDIIYDYSKIERVAYGCAYI